MDSVPPYLLVYYLQIRKHADEVGYLVRRFQDMELDRATYEEAMIRELVDLHLIAVSSQEVEVVFNPLVEEVAPGHVVHRVGRQDTIRIPVVFVVLARGRYVWTELLSRYVAWVLTALVCGFAGGLALDAEGDHLDAWVVAVFLGLALPCLLCLGLVLTNPKAKR